MSSNDSPKHKLGHKNKLKANQCSKSKSQNVSQLSLHHIIPKCALAFHHKSITKLVSETVWKKPIGQNLFQIQNYSENVI